MGIITKGMGAIMKGAKKRKTLTISVPKKKWKNPVTKHPKGSKADLIERIRSLPKEIGGKDIKRFGMGSPKPKKREVVIKKPSKTKLSDTWQDRRIDAMNRKIKKSRGPAMTEKYIDEYGAVSASKAPSKKVYKSIQRKWHGLTPDQQSKIWIKKAERTPGNIRYDKKKFGKK